MRVLITGATGLVGKAIVKLCLYKGIDVHYLTTSKQKISDKKNYKGFFWSPSNATLDKDCFEGVDVIINLAGSTISKRWTASYKTEILQSRVQALQLLKRELLSSTHQVKQLISASAIGIYPDSLTNYYNEAYTETSSGFLGQVSKTWESAADEFTELDIHVAKIRIGLVLSYSDGALPKLIKPISLGLGSAFGSGEQWQSWIHIDDLAQLFLYIMKHNLNGIYNGVAPNPVTNAELIKTIAKVLDSPLLMPKIPKALMRIVLGEMHTLLFESQRVSSKKIENLGFNFKFHHLNLALEDLL